MKFLAYAENRTTEVKTWVGSVVRTKQSGFKFNIDTPDKLSAVPLTEEEAWEYMNRFAPSRNTRIFDYCICTYIQEAHS